jgi:hypothetical protein
MGASNQLAEGRTIWLELIANETQLADTRFLRVFATSSTRFGSQNRKFAHLPPSLEPFQTLRGQSFRRVRSQQKRYGNTIGKVDIYGNGMG